MLDDKSATNRRALLGGIATLGAVTGLAELIPQAAAAEAGGPAAAGFAHWLSSIGGKHRQVFDAPAPNEGMPLLWSFVFLHTGAQAYGVTDKDLGVVIVLRHSAIPIAFTDPLWAKYQLGEVFHINDPASKAPATRNFFVGSKPGDLMIPDASLDKLIARGVKVGVCDTAMKVFSGIVAKKMGMEAEAVHKDWSAGLVPGVTAVPSGVIAVNGAQAHGCTYCFAG
jgi:intracellular sulfur oxidation DsrE/DsrF family protein